MKLIQTSLLSGVSTLVKMLTGFIALKIIAIYLGPGGLALCGQFASVVSIIAVIAGGGISYGIVRYVAEYASSEQKLEFLLSHVSSYIIFFSLPTLVVGLILCKPISLWVFGSEAFYQIIIFLAAAQFFIAFNLVLSSILNGFKQIKLLTLVNVIGALIGLAITFVLIYFYQLTGGLLALIIAQIIPLLISLLFVYREKWLKYLFNFRLNRNFFNKLSHYSLMNIVSVITVPVAQIIVRNDLSDLFSWQAVGYWQAVLRVSDAYLLIITTALTAYYLPRLSELKNNSLLKNEIWQAYKIILPSVLAMVIIIYLLRDFILLLLYTPEFYRSRDLFLFQFIGDFFRIAGWLSTFLLLAKAWTKAYIATEVILSILFILISHFMVRHYGLIGVTYSFAITYFIYWVLMLSTSILYFKQVSNYV